MSESTRPELRNIIAQQLPRCRPETWDELTALARISTFKRGERIYALGEPVPLTMILSGYGVARRTTATGLLLISGVARAGAPFGWSGLAGETSSIEMIAHTSCRVAQWSGLDVRPLAAGDPELALAAIDSMAASLHQTIEQIEGFLHQNARIRVLRILGRHRDLFFDDPAVLTRADLPGLVGTTREMTGRVLRQLEREGTIQRFGRFGLRLLRPEHLDGDGLGARSAPGTDRGRLGNSSSPFGRPPAHRCHT
jgi:CRP-like cAMP-binding protein